MSRARAMRRSRFDNIDFDIAKKDFFSALSVWLVLELFSFLMLPTFRVIEAQDKQLTWFLISVPLGLLGCALIGSSAQLLDLFKARSRSQNKEFLLFLSQLVGWLGLAGVGFPFAIALLEFTYMVSKSSR